MPTTYAKRLKRLDNPPDFLLTPQILNINAEICRHQLIRKDRLHALFPHLSQRQFDRVIYKLFHNGFIAQPDQQRYLRDGQGGSSKTFVSSERRGVQLHTAFFCDPVPPAKYTQDNTSMSWNYMKHQPNTASALVDFRTLAADVPNLTFQTEADVWSNHAPQKHLTTPVFDHHRPPHLMAHAFLADPPSVSTAHSRVPLSFSAPLDHTIYLPGYDDPFPVTINVTVEPDGLFGLSYDTSRYFPFESDEGTETILPEKDFRHSMKLFEYTSLYLKYLSYIAVFRKYAHVKKLGITSFSVITLTTTPTRVASIIRDLKPHLDIHDDFLLFTDRKTLAKFDGNPYHPDHHFLNLKGEPVRLV